MRIGLVVIRYGLDITGGAEFHCRMLAEQLSKKHEVTVLTTNIKFLDKPEMNFNEGLEPVNGIPVLRFVTNQSQEHSLALTEKESKISRKIRRLIHRLGLSKLIFSQFPIWKYKVESESKHLENHPFYSSTLLSYIKEFQDQFDKFIFFTYENPLTVFGSLIIPQKSILIPTAHMESMLFRSINTLVFSQVNHIAFNTESERKMCQDLFRSSLANNSIVGIGVNQIENKLNNIDLNEKFNIQAPYLLYCGRITAVKINNFMQYFLKLKKERKTDLQFVLTGERPAIVENHSDIIYTGFVSEEDKKLLMQKSLAIINPSLAESLSLLTLEALHLGKPVIGNRKCDVMVEHERKSGSVFCYDSFESFAAIIDYLQDPKTNFDTLKIKAQEYVHKHYNWDLVLSKFEEIFKES
ncbi:glycosyltransferase family 4 protein [Sphingobacterium sp. BIGb0165]|uniref:glycosyltransferase family 4 protein n=1 Tax=Sphingobacterium sp. BIGb0165 TaxID=2940615 RepID=UPI002169C652|nr:glycosyltransferase family 4 protein [Sphingobacterium sp. BIGb0165]MCS4225227.1 glycosyltransferase involved in cell wall biosynthesis [Sphingobacterium sp. BIGb0165]